MLIQKTEFGYRLVNYLMMPVKNQVGKTLLQKRKDYLGQTNMEKLQEKYRGTLIGCAIGDTIGMPIEIWSRERIHKYVGRVEEPLDPIEIIPRDAEGKPLEKDEFGKFFKFTREFDKGAITDDTILTLAIAESIIDCQGIDFNDIAKKHLEAYHQYKDKGGFGGTTISAFKRLELGFPYTGAAI